MREKETEHRKLAEEERQRMEESLRKSQAKNDRLREEKDKLQQEKDRLRRHAETEIERLVGNESPSSFGHNRMLEACTKSKNAEKS